MLLGIVSRETRRFSNRLRETIIITKRYYAAPGFLKSQYPDIVIPEQTLPQFIWARTGQWEDLPALTCGLSGRSYTYGMTKMMSEKFAKGLVSKLPMEQGDKIGLLMPNLPEYLIATYGCINAGFVPTFANPLYTNEEITRQFLNAGARCIITIPQLLDNALAVADTLHNYTYTINLSGTTDYDKKILGLDEFLKADTSKVNLPCVRDTDIASLPYSSGTTGLPKGVVLTHKNLIANIIQNSDPLLTAPPVTTSVDDQPVCLSVLPFFHIYGYNGILNFALYHGAHLITIPRFTPKDYLKCLVEYKPSVIFVVPSLVLFLATHPDVKLEYLESIKQVVCAAAPISSNIIEKFRKRLNRTELIFNQGYGMTELSPVALLTPQTMADTKIGSVGRLLPSTEAKIVDLADGNIVTGPNKSGELLIRGPQIMKGYLNNEDATKDIIDDQGWLHTGDVAYYDEDECFYIIDRTKELIKVKGHQVSPTELESILIEIPGVVDCAVVGTQDDAAGERPKAFIVKAPGSHLTADIIKNQVEPKVAKYKRLDGGVQFIDAIPRNPSGKILRHVLKSMNV